MGRTTAEAGIPDDVLVRALTLARARHDGDLSALVTELLNRELARQESLEGVAAWEAEHGEITAEELRIGRRLLG